MLNLRPWRVMAVATLVTARALSFGSAVSARQAPGASLPADEALSAPLPPGVISWWRGEGNANDAIGSNHGALMNGASFAPGLVGTAFQFDGINDVVSIPDAPSLRLNLLSPRTIEAWAFRTSSASPVHLVGHRVGCGGGIEFYQMAIGANAIPTNAVPLNVWSHVAITYDGSVQRQYVNGDLVFAQTVVFPATAPAAPFLIGGSGTCAPFAGRLDEITLYNRALSQPEIQAIVIAGPDGKALAGTLAPPPNLQASVTGSSVRLTWTGVPGATSYALRAGFVPGASNAFDGLIGNVTVLTAAASTGTYFARVHAVAPGLESGPSNEVRIDVGTGGCSAPTAPAGLTATIAGNVVQLSWIAAANATSYVIEAGSGTGLANLVSFDTGSAAISFTAAAPTGSYFVRVRGRNACSLGAASNEVLTLVTGS